MGAATLVSVLVLLIAVPACGGDESAGTPLERGVGYLAREIEQIETADLTIFAYLHRNWELEQLAPAEAKSLELIGRPGDDASTADLLTARLADPDLGPPPPEVLEDYELPPDDSLVVGLAPNFRVLYCDAVPLRRADAALFREAIEAGGYRATHAATALVWSEELECPWRARDELRAEATEALRDELEAAAERGVAGVDDLSVQLGSILVYLGQEEEIPSGWADTVIEAQNDDGGWPSGTGSAEVSDWHTALHAVWFLLGTEDAGAGVPMVRAAER